MCVENENVNKWKFYCSKTANIKNPVDGLNSRLYRAKDKIRELDEVQKKIFRFTETKDENTEKFF